MPASNVMRSVACTLVIGGVAIAVYVIRRRQRIPEIVIRAATKDDLEHLLVVANLKSGAGKDITGDGGDYVREAWEQEWWVAAPDMHYNEFAFVGDKAVGFARIECQATACSRRRASSLSCSARACARSSTRPPPRRPRPRQ